MNVYGFIGRQHGKGLNNATNLRRQIWDRVDWLTGKWIYLRTPGLYRHNDVLGFYSSSGLFEIRS